MKKTLIPLVLIMFLLTSCGELNIIDNNINDNTNIKSTQKAPESQVKPVSKDKTGAVQGLTLLYNNDLNVKLDGFNTVFLNVDGVRVSQQPYNTDFTVLRQVEASIQYLENNNIDFFINVTSGPGFSRDKNISTIFTNGTEAFYFSQMVNEIIRRYIGNPNFKGVSIDIGRSDISENDYYDTLNYIVGKIQSHYSDIEIVYNLYPLSFENDFKDFPDISFNNIIVNAPIPLTGVSYPGNAWDYYSSFQLDKNILLKKLQALKDIADKNKLNVIVSLKTPWVEHSDILLQDLFEITKMLGFNYNLCYGNSDDAYNLYSNKSVETVIERHSN